MQKLKVKEVTFANAILSGLTHIDAARECGYSEKGIQVAAHRMLQKVNVQEYISKELERRKEERRKKYEMDSTDVSMCFKQIFDRCMQNTAVTKFNRESGEYEQETDENGNGVYTFDSNGAVRAMENIGKHIGYYEKDNAQKQPIINIGIIGNIPSENASTEDIEHDEIGATSGDTDQLTD